MGLLSFQVTAFRKTKQRCSCSRCGLCLARPRKISNFSRSPLLMNSSSSSLQHTHTTARLKSVAVVGPWAREHAAYVDHPNLLPPHPRTPADTIPGTRSRSSQHARYRSWRWEYSLHYAAAALRGRNKAGRFQKNLVKPGLGLMP